MLQLLLAEVPVQSDLYFWLTAIAAVAAIFIFGIMVLVAKNYRVCPSNRVLVIYGKAGTARCGDSWWAPGPTRLATIRRRTATGRAIGSFSGCSGLIAAIPSTP